MSLRQAELVLLAMVAATWLLAFALRRHFPRWTSRLRLFAAGVLRLAAGAVFAGTALGVAQLAGGWLALALLLAVMALGMVALGTLTLWMMLTDLGLQNDARES
jgi:hypothetical protein